MSFFLYKPHIEGSKGQITTPDVLIDRVLNYKQPELIPTSTNLLTSSYFQQSMKENKIAPLYALTSLGGGLIISPGAALKDGPINLARKAWRFSTVSKHQEKLTLNGLPLHKTELPKDAISLVQGVKNKMPRGLTVICLGPWTHLTETFVVELSDPILGRSLKHNISIEMTDKDQWPSRPIARYSTGPTQRKVEDYI
ncbi:MAG: hypothetical protein CMM32_07615 [Rhodospirillaceae bacterium]|nr:hypothetical protein [Rhodospirillaceae bacterium]|tara:strand:+ start:1513 stop:2103 length:591 start_codon:yes stop_codon:yes gene_type:complete